MARDCVRRRCARCASAEAQVGRLPQGEDLLGAPVVGDIIVRLAESIVTIFGARETGRRIDAEGLRIIENGFRFWFL